jgi:hypothetical protein
LVLRNTTEESQRVGRGDRDGETRRRSGDGERTPEDAHERALLEVAVAGEVGFVVEFVGEAWPGCVVRSCQRCSAELC